MSNRSTRIGRMFRLDPPHAVRALELAIEEKRGNLRRIAEHLFLSRRHLYRWIERGNLWPVVDRARERHEEWWVRTNAVLGGEDE